MERVFGIPADTLAVALLVLTVTAFGTIAVLAVRNRAFARLATRSVSRRKGRSALIVAGLMLATAIVSSALATGDTVGRTIRGDVLRALGNTDMLVSVKGADVDPTLELDTTTRTATFDETLIADVRAAAQRSPLVDGVAPSISEPIAVQDVTSRQTEPRVTLFGSDPTFPAEAFSPITTTDGRQLTLADAGEAGVFLTKGAAEELDASAGDQVVLYGGGAPTTASVAAVVDFRGAGEDGPAVLATLSFTQAVLGLEGQVGHVMISNVGDDVSGAALSDAVADVLAPAVAPMGLEVAPVKQDGLDRADEQGNAFMSLFSTFGTFSIAAGILLIFLIFVMLAAERRTELGIARAIGTQRRHLVQTFVFEGGIYDVLAAAAGAAIGLGIAYGIVEGIASAFHTEGFEIEHGFRLRSVLIAYGLGVVLTLGVVAVSAWRVSRLDIVAAVRNLPSTAGHRSRKARWMFGLVGVVAGVAVTASGASAAQGTPFMLGVSIVVVSLVPVARVLGTPDRLAYTVAGVALVVWWLLPLSVVESLVGDLAMDFSIWITAGLMVVLGATWTVMYNADVLLGGLGRAAGRIRSLAPVIRMAVAYPLRSRVRTGMTLAMFMLVVYTLVTGTTISGSFIRAFDNLESFSGGFDVRAVVSPVRAFDDAEAALQAEPELGQHVEAVGSQSMLPVEARQAGVGAEFADYPMRGLDDRFLAETTYGLAARARGFESDAGVWDAVREQPGLAVVDAFAAPRRDNFAFGVVPDFQLEGFYVEDGVFDPVTVEVRDPVTGGEVTLTVVGVLRDDTPFEMAGVSTSQAVLAPFGERARPTTYWVRLAAGADPALAAESMESAFLDHGLEAETLQDRLDEGVAASWTINRLIQGFLALGLVVGVVALGVISARAVVERRQQIGVLRAIGFQPSMVRLSFIAEASFISLAAIVMGTALGLLTALNVVADVGGQQDVAFAVPWLNLVVIFAVVYAAALASTYFPAVRGSRVYPAEALRYE